MQWSFLNPFDIEEDGLVCLLSGASVPPDISKDIETAEDRGRQAKDTFINDRLKKNEDFFAPLTKEKLKTFADIGKMVLVKTTQNKTIEYKQQTFAVPSHACAISYWDNSWASSED